MLKLAGLQPIKSNTLRDQAVTLIKQMIVDGVFEPDQRLTEANLSDALGISRGPLREAIRDLVDARLLISLPYKGIFVRSVSRKDLEEIYTLRRTLEVSAFKQCWAKRTSQSRADLYRLHKRLLQEISSGEEPDTAIAFEFELHNWCYQLSENALLIQCWERLKPSLQYYFLLHQRAHNRAGPFEDAHDRYVELACGEDLDAMILHLEEHLQQGLIQTIQWLPGAADSEQENIGERHNAIK